MWFKAIVAAVTAVVGYLLATLSQDAAEVALTASLNATYDYIIVGAGSAGCVLANRLTEDGDVTVLLVEAGRDDRGNVMINTPAMAGMLHHTELDWDYLTVPQTRGFEGLKDRKGYCAFGRVLGGSSSVNYMVWVRGHPRDYDHWAEQGCEGWSFKDVLPYFIKSEHALDMDTLDPDYHGTGGPMKVTTKNTLPLTDVILKASKEMGLPLVDPNADGKDGVSLISNTVYKGERYSAARAYLHPVRNRPNLHVIVNSFVTRVLFENKRAVGVELIRGFKKQVVRARREVILSAGAVGSPKLLLLSGVGPKRHLQDVGMKALADLPVGENLQNHLYYALQLALKQPLGGATPEDFASTWSWLQLKLFGTGPLSNFGAETQMFLSTSEENRRRQWWDIHVIFLAGIFRSYILQSIGYTDQVVSEASRRDELEHGFLCIPKILRPGSRGTVRLQTSDPFDSPLIDHNYLDDPEDLTTLVRGIKKCLDLLKTPSLQAVGAELADAPSSACVGGDSEVGSDSYWTCMARRNPMPAFNHNVGTCKMGGASDPAAVVDPKLRVRGLRGLRVVDASVMPTLPAANINAAVVMLAEKAADIIRSGQ